MRRLLLLALALTSSACGQLIGLDDPLNASANDMFCYGTGIVHVCFSQLPTGTDVPVVYDTSTQGCNNNVISGGEGLCVIGQTSFTISAAMTVAADGASTDSIPLVLVATDSITIDGTLDASERHQGGSGSSAAGSDFSGCQPGTSPTSNAMNGAGGQGGSFIALGGNGGSGSSAGGIAGAALPEPTTVHGGCPGRAGSNSGGNGGRGGGAVYLIASNSIAITGRLDASGAGGSTSNDFNLAGMVAGGSGGGAGGMIGLDAPSVSITGAVCAIGGSGGGGSTGTQSSSGGDASGGTTACTVGSPGNSSGGGSGGAGASNGAGTAGSPGTSGGGGGGGGSSGYIRIYTTHTGSGAIAPTPKQG